MTRLELIAKLAPLTLECEGEMVEAGAVLATLLAVITTEDYDKLQILVRAAAEITMMYVTQRGAQCTDK